MKKYLLATDLDGTLFPNNHHRFDVHDYEVFRRMISRDDLVFAAITGRHFALAESGFREFNIPDPDFLVGDVGTTIYEKSGDSWRENSDWAARCAADFGNRDTILRLFSDFSKIFLQEVEKQNHFKISFYYRLSFNGAEIRREMQEKLDREKINAVVVVSIDHLQNIGLVDILPKSATKEDALQFLVKKTGVASQNALYCGDTGNDLFPLTAGFPAVLVGNATDAIRVEARALAQKRKTEEKLFFAKKNYAGGILEGIAHFFGADFF